MKDLLFLLIKGFLGVFMFLIPTMFLDDEFSEQLPEGLVKPRFYAQICICLVSNWGQGAASLAFSVLEGFPWWHQVCRDGYQKMLWAELNTDVRNLIKLPFFW